MHIKAFKMDMKPRRFLFINHTLYLLTHSAIHIIDFKGDIKPDISLENVTLNESKREVITGDENEMKVMNQNNERNVTNGKKILERAINIDVKDVLVVKQYVLVQSVDNDMYYVKAGKTGLTRYCMKVEKIVYNEKIYFINDNCIFETSVTKLREYPKVVLVFPGKIENLEILDGRLLFFASRKVFLAEKTNLYYDNYISSVNSNDNFTANSNAKESDYRSSKKLCRAFNFVEIGALSELQFVYTANNKRFVLLTTIDSIIVLSYNTETVVLKKPDELHHILLVDSYILIFSHKILIYSAIDGLPIKEIALTAFNAVYDEVSDCLVMYNGVLFCASMSELINGTDGEIEQICSPGDIEQNNRKFIRDPLNCDKYVDKKKNISVAKHLTADEEANSGVPTNFFTNDQTKDLNRDMPKEYFECDEKTLITENDAMNSNTTVEEENDLYEETNIQKESNFDALIKHKLFKFAYPINPKQTFLHYSRCAYKSQNVLKALFFYAQTTKKYAFDRSNVIELCQQKNKIDLMTYKVALKCDIANNMRVTVGDLIYFLCIRSVFMNKETNYLFYLFCILEMKKHQRNLLRFAIENEIRIKLLERIDIYELIKEKIEQKTVGKEQQIRSEESNELLAQEENVKYSTSAEFLSFKPLSEHISTEHRENRSLITKHLSKKLVVQYWKIYKPEKAVIYYFVTEKYEKCARLLLKTHLKIPQLQSLLLKIQLFTKVANVSVLKLYDVYFPDLLMLLTKYDATESLLLYFRHVIDPLKKSQIILKSVQKMDGKGCEMILSAINEMEMSEHMKDFSETLEFVCNEKKEVKGSIFKCSGKVINP
ncbi:hypothetical protein THOM_0340 [Trachipleistophora hominis]|uniref:Uncharacterized protein n=1 Tax=Trachipleistophora hominis TaxID=72359 RepID=L7JYW4_TRAHO|nr:hypothetical protein THOM_0340 [Trachipleistophora hominis]